MLLRLIVTSYNNYYFISHNINLFMMIMLEDTEQSL